MDKTVYPLSRYWYSGEFRFYYAYGNTPPQDYLQNCLGKRKPEILVLGCGDIRSCFYSIWKNLDTDHPSQFDEVRFVLNDLSPAVLARNVLFLYLCLHKPKNDRALKSWLSGIWAIWYCHELHLEHAKMLRDALSMLCKYSAMWSSKENPLYPMVKFYSSSTLNKVHSMWKMWLEGNVDISASQMHTSRQSQFQVHGREFPTDECVSEYITGSAEIPFHYLDSDNCKLQKSEVQLYIKTGSVYAETVFDVNIPKNASTVVNLTLFERSDGKYSLHYGSMPFSCYFQTVEFTAKKLQVINPTSKTSLLVKDKFFGSVPFLSNSVQQFSLWVQSCSKVFHDNQRRVTFEFECSDASAFCFDLASKEANCAFDLVYTSNLMDHLAPPNLILPAAALLKDSGTIFSASLSKKIFSTFDEYLMSSFGFDCKLLPLVLGIRCINYEGEAYSSPVAVQSFPLTLRNNAFVPREKLVLWEKVSSDAVPLIFPPGSKLPDGIGNALAQCIKVSVFPLLVSPKVPLMLNNLCVETAIKVLEVFMSRALAEYTPHFWEPLSATLCTTIAPYCQSMQTQLLLHGIHMHLTVREDSCPLCMRVPLSSHIGLFCTKVPLQIDFDTPNFLAVVHTEVCDSAIYLQNEALRSKDIHVFDCVSPSTDHQGSFLELCFYAPLHLAHSNYKVTLLLSHVNEDINILYNVDKHPTVQLSSLRVSYTSFIFSQPLLGPDLKECKLNQFGVISSHISDGDMSELSIDLSDCVLTALDVSKLQTRRVSSKQLYLYCGKVGCHIEFPVPFDYDQVHIKIMKKDGMLSLACVRACQQFEEEKPLFVVTPDKDLSLFPNPFSEDKLVALSGQQVTKKELVMQESCKGDSSQLSPLMRVKETLPLLFKRSEYDFFNFLLPVKGVHGLVLVNKRLFNYENRAPVVDIAFCFLEESFVKTVASAWVQISSSFSVNIKVDFDEYEVIKNVFHYFAGRTVGTCESSINPCSKLNLLVETGIHKYFTRAVISLLLCDPDHYFTQVVSMKMSESDQNLESLNKRSEKCDQCAKFFKTTKFCSNCKTVKYCSKACQRAHWTTHKVNCKRKQPEAELDQAKEPPTPCVSKPSIPQQDALPPFDHSFKIFPLVRYKYEGDFTLYYAFESTPAEDYLQSCVGVNNPMVLLLECGDMASCFYTLWKNFSTCGAPKRFSRVNFVLNDNSPAVLARNILILYLTFRLPKGIENMKKWLCAIWGIWYCHELYPHHWLILSQSLNLLLKHSQSLDAWKSSDNPLSNVVQFSSMKTLSKISEVWKMWTAKKRESVTEMYESRLHFLACNEQLEKCEYLASTLSRAWSAVYGDSAGEVCSKIGKLSHEIVAYIHRGSCFAESVLNVDVPSSPIVVNPTLYERPDGEYSLYFGSLPFHSYFHTVEFSPEKLASSGVLKEICNVMLVESKFFDNHPLLANCVQQFAMWIQSASRAINSEAATFTFNCQQPLTFCQEWQLCTSEQNYCDWQFDLIYTSNLIDHQGLPNTVLSGMQLLKCHGLMFTKTLMYKGYVSSLDDLLKLCFGFDSKLLPVILGFRCINHEGTQYSSPVMVEPFPSQPISPEVAERSLRNLVWKKVSAQPFNIPCLPDVNSGNITEALIDSITTSAFGLLNNTGYPKMFLSNENIETAILLLQTFLSSVKSPLLYNSWFWIPLSTALCDKLKPHLHCFQTQLLLHKIHIHLTVTADDCPLCNNCSIKQHIGLFCAKLALPLPESSPVYMAIVHREETFDAQYLGSKARLSDDIHIFDCFDGAIHQDVLKLNFFVPLKFVRENYFVTVCETSLCPNESVFKSALPTTKIKDLQVKFVSYDFLLSVKYPVVCEDSTFGELSSHICDEEKVHSEITLSASALKSLTISSLSVTKMKPNVLKLACEPHRFVLMFKYPIGKFDYNLNMKEKKIEITSFRAPHNFEDEDPMFLATPDHQLSLPSCHLKNPMVLMHCCMQFTPDDVCARKECKNDKTIMPHLLNLKDAWISFFRDRDGVFFFLKSREGKLLGLALIDRCIFDYERKVPALDMAFCFLEDYYDVRQILSAWSSMDKSDLVNTVVVDYPEYSMLQKLVGLLSKRTNGDCKSAGRQSRFHTLCQYEVDMYFKRVVAYLLYCDPDLQGISAIENHLATCDDIVCDCCGKQGSIAKSCKGCGEMKYCSMECYTKHQPEHSDYCVGTSIKYNSPNSGNFPGTKSSSCTGTKSGASVGKGTGTTSGASVGKSTGTTSGASVGKSTGTKSGASVGKGKNNSRTVKDSCVYKKKSNSCSYCGSFSDTLRRCVRCRGSYYCSKKCQVSHWPVHKLECKKTAQSETATNASSAKNLSSQNGQDFASSNGSHSSSAKSGQDFAQKSSTGNDSSSAKKSSSPKGEGFAWQSSGASTVPDYFITISDGVSSSSGSDSSSPASSKTESSTSSSSAKEESSSSSAKKKPSSFPQEFHKLEEVTSQYGLTLTNAVRLNRDGCGYCGKMSVPLMRCAKCGLSKYCSKLCQKKDWNTHKTMCRVFGK